MAFDPEFDGVTSLTKARCSRKKYFYVSGSEKEGGMAFSVLNHLHYVVPTVAEYQ